MNLNEQIKKWVGGSKEYTLGVAYLMATGSNQGLAARLGAKQTAQNKRELEAALKKHLLFSEKKIESDVITNFLDTATSTVELTPAHLQGEEKKRGTSGHRQFSTGNVGNRSAASRRAKARASSGGCSGCGG